MYAIRSYYDHTSPIKKIACGANVDDYYWTEEVLKVCHDPNMMQGLSLHYYTIPGEWLDKGSATDFDASVWYRTMKKTLYMETLINRHGAIMDKYDPENRITSYNVCYTKLLRIDLAERTFTVRTKSFVYRYGI